MKVTATMTFLSAKIRTFTSGELAGRTFRRVHFLDGDGEPVSIYVNDQALFDRFINECIFGDLLVLSLSVRSGNNGMYTEITGYEPAVKS